MVEDPGRPSVLVVVSPSVLVVVSSSVVVVVFSVVVVVVVAFVVVGRGVVVVGAFENLQTKSKP